MQLATVLLLNKKKLQSPLMNGLKKQTKISMAPLTLTNLQVNLNFFERIQVNKRRHIFILTLICIDSYTHWC